VSVTANARRSSGQLALGLAVVSGQREQDGVDPRMHAQRRQSTLRVVGDVRAELRQQERDPLI
jgi:hypothetical protein